MALSKYLVEVERHQIVTETWEVLAHTNADAYVELGACLDEGKPKHVSTVETARRTKRPVKSGPPDAVSDASSDV